jgi:hypothetical protein
MMVSSSVESAPTGKVSQRLGRAQDIIHVLEGGGRRIRLGPSPPASPAATHFSPDEFARYFGDVDAAVVGPARRSRATSSRAPGAS